MTIPGLGPVTASAIAASIEDVSAFSGPREFAAFLGLTPRQNSSGGKERLGRISKMGNRYLRTLLVVGAHAVLYHRKRHEDAAILCEEADADQPFKLVAVALANKMARIAKGCTRIEGDQEVMRRARIDPKARGLVCAVKRANVIGARDQRTTSGPTGVMTRIDRPKT